MAGIPCDEKRFFCKARPQDAGAPSVGVPGNMPNKYQQLITDANQLTSQLNERYRAHLQCQSGCSGCCHHHLSVFPVEAAMMKSTIENLSNETKTIIKLQAQKITEQESRGEAVACPLLIDDQCSIYDSRPVICRTQGLPLLYEAEDGNSEVDFCPLNFTTENATDELEENHLVPLDTLNLRLSIANLEYCQVHEIEPNQRIKIADLCS